MNLNSHSNGYNPNGGGLAKAHNSYFKLQTASSSNTPALFNPHQPTIQTRPNYSEDRARFKSNAFQQSGSTQMFGQTPTTQAHPKLIMQQGLSSLQSGTFFHMRNANEKYQNSNLPTLSRRDKENSPDNSLMRRGPSPPR